MTSENAVGKTSRQLRRGVMKIDDGLLPRFGVAEYSWGTLHQQKIRAVQVFYHPHDPDPNAGGGSEGLSYILSDLLLAG